MPRSSRIESVFLNIPYDNAFQNLYLAYIVGPTQLGLRINATLAIPNQGRLKTIMDLIEQSNFSIHDLSRIELSSGIPRFNMPVELGLASTDQGSQEAATEFIYSRANPTAHNAQPVMSTG